MIKTVVGPQLIRSRTELNHLVLSGEHWFVVDRFRLPKLYFWQLDGVFVSDRSPRGLRLVDGRYQLFFGRMGSVKTYEP